MLYVAFTSQRGRNVPESHENVLLRLAQILSKESFSSFVDLTKTNAVSATERLKDSQLQSNDSGPSRSMRGTKRTAANRNKEPLKTCFFIFPDLCVFKPSGSFRLSKAKNPTLKHHQQPLARS